MFITSYFIHDIIFKTRLISLSYLKACIFFFKKLKFKSKLHISWFYTYIKILKIHIWAQYFLYAFEFQIWMNLYILLILQYYSFVIIQKHY